MEEKEVDRWVGGSAAESGQSASVWSDFHGSGERVPREGRFEDLRGHHLEISFAGRVRVLRLKNRTLYHLQESRVLMVLM